MKKNLPLVILLLLHVVLLIKTQFTLWPEMISFPYLINNGFSLYGDMVYVYPPFLAIVLSLLTRVFGYEANVILFVTYALVLINDVVIFRTVLLLKQTKTVALIAVFLYAIMTLGLEGNMLWFDTALVTPVLLGSYYLLKNTNKSFYISGIFFTIACLTKQTGTFYLIIAFLYVALFYKKQIIQFLSVPIISGGLTVLWLTVTRQLEWFWNWVVSYPSQYWTHFPGYVDLQLSNNQILIVVLLSVIPGLLLIFTKDKQARLFSIMYFLGIFAVYPRFSFFHLQVAIAFAAILVALFIKQLKYVSITISILIVGLIFPNVMAATHKPIRFLDDNTLKQAREISNHTEYSKDIYLLGLPSHLYQLTNSLPPKPWLDNYGWYFEVSEVQEQTISSWQNNAPTFIIVQEPNQGNWFDIGVYQPQKVMAWIRDNYHESSRLEEKIVVMKRNY